MRLTMDELACKYNVPFDVVSDAISDASLSGVHEARENVLHLTYNVDDASEAIGSYIAKKIHETYVPYAQWEEYGKRFDAVVIGRKD